MKKHYVLPNNVHDTEAGMPEYCMFYDVAEIDARIAELESLLRELDGHFKVLAASDIHIWPNHPLNPRTRIANVLRADS